MNALKQYREISSCVSPRMCQQSSKKYIKDNRREITTQRELIGAIQQKKNDSFKLNGMVSLNSNSCPIQRDVPDTAKGVVGFGNVMTSIAGLLDFFVGGGKAAFGSPGKRRYIRQPTLTINNIRKGVVDGGKIEDEEGKPTKIEGGSISIGSGDIILEKSSIKDECLAYTTLRKVFPFLVPVAGGLTTASSVAAICKAPEKIVSGLSGGAALGYAGSNIWGIIEWLITNRYSRSAPIKPKQNTQDQVAD